MSKMMVFLTGVFIFILAGCQAAPTSPRQPTDLPIPAATSLPTTIPQPTKTLYPTPSPQPAATLLAPTKAVEPVNIMAFCTLMGKDPKTMVSQGTPVVIIWGWSAKTEAQIKDFLENNITVITLDGKTIEGTLNSAVTKNATSGDPEVAWYADVGVLEVGDHPLTYDVSWKKMIDDGTSTYGPGGKIETSHDECQIIVQ